MNIAKWKELSVQLKKVKAEEMELRKEIVEELIANLEMENGRLTVKDHIQGYDVKAVQTIGYRLDKKVLGQVWNDLLQEEQDCVEMKPTLKVSAYKELNDSSPLHDAVTTYLAAPTLTVEVPE